MPDFMYIIFGVVFLVELAMGIFFIRRGRHWMRHPELAEEDLRRSAARRGLNFDALVADPETFQHTLVTRGRVFLGVGIFLSCFACATLIGGIVVMQVLNQTMQQAMDSVDPNVIAP